ncbi:calcium-binding protein [Rhizobium sp. LjRoot254]|uniref:calcium-binding protein n=1 Tax=Rhizobium sp. LjRoot254 TaxID=3342297 RepID=UPI003ECE36C3
MATYYFSSSNFTQIPALSDSIYILDPTTWIFTDSSPAVFLGTGAYGNELIIRGMLASAGTDPVLDIDAEGTRVTIDKGGYLTGTNVISLTAVSSDIVNRGHIDASNVGIRLQESAGRLVNYGEISAAVNGFGVRQNATAGAFEFENHGVMTGYGAMHLEAPDVTITLGKASEILAVNAIQVVSGAGDIARITNAGLISAQAGAAYFGGNGEDSFTNRGTIYGDIYFGAGDNMFIDKGKFVGQIYSGIGDDLFVVKSADIVITDLGGIDTVRTGVSYTLASGLENLILTGGKNASLTGNDGANALRGNGGGNRIEGGQGEDILTGGGGRDIFLYATLDGGDTITDFKQGQDRIRIEGFTLYDSFADLDFEKSGKDVRINFADGSGADFILVENQKVGDFDKGDFIFG